MSSTPRDAPAPDTCHIWRIPLDAAPPWLSLDLLSEIEEARAGRFRVRRDQERFALCHCAVRHILGRYLRRDPARLAFEAGEHGRPRLAAAEGEQVCIDFNLTHSSDLALLAVVSSGPVGIDVEALREMRRSIALAQRYMTQAESRAIEAAPPATRSTLFLTCWTRKEAVLKCTGAGLTLAPRSFEVGANDSEVIIEAPLERGQCLRVRSVSPCDGYVAACATGSPVVRIQWHDLSMS